MTPGPLTFTCRRCLYTASHPLGITCDDAGICSGCRVHEEKDSLDWTEREARLSRLLAAYRGRARGRHDCVVPITGARDSFYIVHLVRKVYGLNPLLVVYNRHYNSRAGIANIEHLRTVFGCDIITLTLDPRLISKIMRATLAERGSFHWHALAGHTVFPVWQAVRRKIPLVIWGAQQGLEQVGMYSHRDEVEMTRRYRREHDLMGLEAEALVDRHELGEAELRPFFYPSDADLRQSGVRGIYLGNFIRWDTKAQHEEMLARYGYYTGPLARTFDRYNDIDDLHFTGAHDLIKRLKHGYGRATDDACREIRYGRLARGAGLAMVRHYEAQPVTGWTDLEARTGLTQAEMLAMVAPHQAMAGAVLPYGPAHGAAEGFFRCHTPAHFSGDPHVPQLLTRGYSPE